MFRASPWIPYDPSSHHQHDNNSRSVSAQRNNSGNGNSNNTTTTTTPMDVPEISILRDDDDADDSPPPSGRRGFTKFRVNMHGAWEQSNGSVHFAGGAPGNNPTPGSARVGSSSSRRGTHHNMRARGGSPVPGIESNNEDDVDDEEEEEEEEEEDQLIDDEEVFPRNDSFRGLLPSASSSSSINVGADSAAHPDGATSTSTPRRRGGGPPRGRSRRAGPSAGAAPTTGRRGRPGREPPDAAAMMSTFELGRKAAEDLEDLLTRPEPSSVAASSSSAVLNPLPTDTALGTASSSNIPPSSNIATPEGWSVQSQTPAKPPRKKPGPKKGTTLGPRGPRKNAAKTAVNTPGTATPLDDSGAVDASTFLIPTIPSMPATPKPEQNALPSTGGTATPHQQQPPSQSTSSHPYLSPIIPPDFSADPTIPVPLWPLPTRAFPVQPPPKIPTGYAPSHPLDTKRPPPRKWVIMKREIRGIAGGRWFTRAWVSGAMPDVPDANNSSGLSPPSTAVDDAKPNLIADPDQTSSASAVLSAAVESGHGLGLTTQAPSPPLLHFSPSSLAMSTSAAAAALLEVSKREHERELAKDRERGKEREQRSDMEVHSLSGSASEPPPPPHQRELSQLDHLAQAAATFSRLPEVEPKRINVNPRGSYTPAAGVDTDGDIEMRSTDDP